MAKYDGIEKYIFSDVYLFFLKYKDIIDEPYYWNVCEQDYKMLCFKYNEHPLAVSLLDCTKEQLKHKVKNLPLIDCSGKYQFTHEEWEKRLEIAKKTTFR